MSQAYKIEFSHDFNINDQQTTYHKGTRHYEALIDKKYFYTIHPVNNALCHCKVKDLKLKESNTIITWKVADCF